MPQRFTVQVDRRNRSAEVTYDRLEAAGDEVLVGIPHVRLGVVKARWDEWVPERMFLSQTSEWTGRQYRPIPFQFTFRKTTGKFTLLIQMWRTARASGECQLS